MVDRRPTVASSRASPGGHALIIPESHRPSPPCVALGLVAEDAAGQLGLARGEGRFKRLEALEANVSGDQ